MAGETGWKVIARIAALAWPLLVGQWAVMGFSLIDTVMTGHASPDDLAAMALGSAIYSSVFVGLMGVVLALNPIIAQHFGAGRKSAIGQAWVQGLWLAFGLCLAGELALLFPHTWLVMSQASAEVGQRVAHYLHALGFALPAALLFRTVFAMNTAVSRPRVVMAINLAALAVKVPLNYLLIYGKLGIPALGAAGCGYATATVMWASCAIALALVRYDPFYRPFAIRMAWPAWRGQLELLRIGVPTGFAYVVDITSFTFMALLAARLGTSVVGGHQIAGNLAALCFGFPLAIAVATSTLAAQAIGAQQPLQARSIVATGIRTAVSVALAVSALVWVCRAWIIAAYTSDAAVQSVALSLIPFLVLFHVGDATQATATFCLRAYKHVIAPLLINTVSLWGLGLVGGYWLAFRGAGPLAPMGISGLWTAAAASLVLSALAQSYRLRQVVNAAIVGAAWPSPVEGNVAGSI